jgi:hypothetical protein
VAQIRERLAQGSAQAKTDDSHDESSSNAPALRERVRECVAAFAGGSAEADAAKPGEGAQ